MQTRKRETWRWAKIFTTCALIMFINEIRSRMQPKFDTIWNEIDHSLFVFSFVQICYRSPCYE